MINRYMNTIGNKKLELFDMGAGASEPTAEENVQLASGKVINGICNLRAMSWHQPFAI